MGLRPTGVEYPKRNSMWREQQTIVNRSWPRANLELTVAVGNLAERENTAIDNIRKQLARRRGME